MKIFILIYDSVYHSLFTYDKSGMKIFILIYIADIIVTGTSLPFILHLINCLNGDFSLKDLGPLHYLLKIKVHRGVQKTHRPAKPDPTHRVGSVFKAWWVGLGYQKNYYRGSGWVWVIKLQTRQTRPNPPIFNIYLKYILYLII